MLSRTIGATAASIARLLYTPSSGAPTPFYAEGTWTPVLRGFSTAGTQTYTTQLGRYERSGNKVTVWFNIALATLDGTAAGVAQITGLPYAAANNSVRYIGPVGAAALITHAVGYTQFYCLVNFTDSLITIQESGSNVAIGNVDITQFSGTSTIRGSVSYII